MSSENTVFPIFSFYESGALLYKGQYQIKRNGIDDTGEAQIYFHTLPKAHITIELNSYQLALSDIINDEKVDFSIDNSSFPAFVISSQSKYEATYRTELKLIAKENKILLGSTNDDTKYIIFHLFNFYHFGIRDKSEIVVFEDGSQYRLDYIILEDENYTIKLQSTRDTSKNISKIKKDGTSRLTQVGRIEKKNGLISLQEYEDLQTAIKNFLSFAKGSWINPCCSVGQDEDKENRWYILNAPECDWYQLNSWIDPLENSFSMSELFPQFMNLWRDENWKDTLTEVIYWFINANDTSRGIDVGLILAQTALERLSFEYVVNQKKLLSVNGFKDIWASDKFRVILSSLNIPLEIPAELVNLTNRAKSDNWLDAPHALTEMRNSLVHPEHKKRGKFDIHIFIEAHTLSLWYLEVAILAICEFQGKYANRIKKGIVEDVPYLKKV